MTGILNFSSFYQALLSLANQSRRVTVVLNVEVSKECFDVLNIIELDSVNCIT